MLQETMMYGLSNAELVHVVSKAMEVLSSGGAKAIDYAADGAGWSDLTGNDRSAAGAVWERVLMLPAEQNLALMWRVLKDNPRLGEPVLNDLTCFVAHHIRDGNRFGREGLRYWVRHWARRDGSSREAAQLYGRSYDTHQRFYREQVQLCLDGWFVAAKGALEQVVDEQYGNYRQAA
ncbi:hypothetical protein [Pseudogulbenkiania sp. NH8B]|uniref:hypothetical protein n=1 Tax=Pseudogulbenkiania sp. (strain NH8B) TaxID=748280 RepID=UPI0011D1C51B|nr:hypothetical protein [Pseudogulbenkiania sp. NH8B]